MDQTAVQWKDGTLTKISNNPNKLRTQSVTGIYQNEPMVGRPFTILSESLEFSDGLRMVQTSPVLNVIKNEAGLFQFETENSIYRLQEITDGV